MSPYTPQPSTDLTSPTPFQLLQLCRNDERIHAAYPRSGRILSIERPVNDDGDPSSFLPRDWPETGVWMVTVGYTANHPLYRDVVREFHSIYGYRAGRFELWVD